MLDTVVWLWSIDAVDRLNKTGREILSNAQEELYLSAASAWELSIKASLGRYRLPSPPAQCIPAFMEKQGLRPLPVNHLHASKVYELPPHHRDPFDRLLIAQALVEGMAILTADRHFEKYPIDVVWCGR